MTERKRKLDVDDSSLAGPPAKQPALGSVSNGSVPPVDNVNPYTGKVYSQTYWNIMQKRRTLPVWQARP